MESSFNSETSPPSPAQGTNWRLLLELSSFTFFIIPFGNIIVPLVLWLIKKDSLPFVDQEGKKVLNFNLSWAIWSFVSCGLGLIPWFIIAVIATLKAANNENFKHPLTIRFLH